MRPEGPWQRLAAALTDSSGFSMTISCPRSKWPILIGRPYRLLPESARQRKSINEQRKEQRKRKYWQPVPSSPKRNQNARKLHTWRAWPALFSAIAQVRSIISSGGVLLALIHPILVLPKNSNTALVDFSLHSHLTGTALSGLPPSAAALAYSSAFSLPRIPWWAGTHQTVISLSLDNTLLQPSKAATPKLCPARCRRS